MTCRTGLPRRRRPPLCSNLRHRGIFLDINVISCTICQVRSSNHECSWRPPPCLWPLCHFWRVLILTQAGLISRLATDREHKRSPTCGASMLHLTTTWPGWADLADIHCPDCDSLAGRAFTHPPPHPKQLQEGLKFSLDLFLCVLFFL